MVDISRSAATDAELDTELESGGRRWPALTAFTVTVVISVTFFVVSTPLVEAPAPQAAVTPAPVSAPATATPAPTAAPAASDASSNSGNSSGTTSAPASTAAPKATAAPTAPATVIPQTADSFPLILLAMLALCSAAALTGLVICRKKEH